MTANKNVIAKIFILIMFTILFSSMSFAQTENIRGIKFKDGSTVYGTVTELSVHKVTILTKNSEQITRRFEDIEAFIKESDENIKSKSHSATAEFVNYVVLKAGVYTPESGDLKDSSKTGQPVEYQ